MTECIEIRYSAQFHGAHGTARETVTTEAASPRALCDELGLAAAVPLTLAALEAVLRDLDGRLGRGEVDAVTCLGDLVGYATWPNEVVATVQGGTSPRSPGTTTRGSG